MAVRENFSRKREAIYQTVCDTKVHPTAEWVYEALKPVYPDLSLGTVYRNLKKFCESGKIRRVGVINGQEHFDADGFQAQSLCLQCMRPCARYFRAACRGRNRGRARGKVQLLD